MLDVAPRRAAWSVAEKIGFRAIFLKKKEKQNHKPAVKINDRYVKAIELKIKMRIKEQRICMRGEGGEESVL